MNYFDRLYGQIAALTERAEHAEARAEKAEARVAELEAQVAAWSPARCYGEEDEVWDGCPKCGPSRVQRSDECYACGWASDPVPIQAKTAPKTPVPAPEPTETVQTAPPPSPAGAPRSDQGGEIETDTGNPGPGRIDPRGSESSLLDTPMPRPSRMPDGIVEAWQDGGRVFGTYSGGPRVELVPVPPDDGPVRTFVVAPQRALTAEEADAYTELLGNELADAPKRPRPPRIAPREPDVSAEVGLMGALQDRIHKEAGPYRAAEATRVEEPKLVTSCFDARCQCYQCVKDRADEEEDFRDLAKEQAKQAVVRQVQDAAYRAVTDILTRVEASPAAAAEVEARTGAYGRGLTKAEAAAYEGVLHGFMRDAMKGLGDVIDPPRAGLPSRDEVAAFLEGWWPK